MEEILLTVKNEDWELIKSGKKTLIVNISKPTNIFYPFRTIVYVTDLKKVVGKFDVYETFRTIRPDFLVEGSCLTLKQILFRTDGNPFCGWRIKENTVFEYEKPFTLEEATGRTKPPASWCYLNKDVENE